MNRRPPRYPLINLVVSTQGIVGIVTGVVAAAIGWLLAATAGIAVAWLVAGVCFLITVIALFVYWQRSLAEINAAIRPLYPTPPDEIDAPF